jgi:glycolate oxidase iron-sulfur subunit
MNKVIELLQSKEYRAKLDQCIHCGLCLQACPTYDVFGTEMDSPRGRIALMRAVSEGRITEDRVNGAFATHTTRCLACRACETACPSGVQYGALLEPARELVEQHRTLSLAERTLRWMGLHQLMSHRERLKLLASALWLYQKTGLQRLVRRVNLLPLHLRAMEAIIPPLTPRYVDYSAPAPAAGEQRGRVAFVIGCIQEAFLAPVNQATRRVLRRNGFEIVTPMAQTCCGAAHAHVGELDAARALARRNIDAFLAEDVMAIIVNAGGCGLALKEYPHLLKDDPIYAERAQRFASLVRDVNEFLADYLHCPPRGEMRVRATYVDSCHLRHGQRVSRQPRDLLRTVPGLELIELRQPDRCCGSAGVYNIAQPEIADQVLDAKMRDVAATGATLVVTTNTGCHLQLIAGVRKAGLNATVMHVVEVLDESYRRERASQGR